MNKEYDVIVVGGGAAGMMAAVSAAELGLKTAIIEKNNELGKKLLITGGGRCNFTHLSEDVSRFIARCDKKERFLYSALSLLTPKDVREFFHLHGVPSYVQEDLCVFPESDNAEDVRNVFRADLNRYGVKVFTGISVTDFLINNSMISGVRIGKKEVKGKVFVLATGGITYPTTGSTGDGYDLAKESGHHIVDPIPSLVPIYIKDKSLRQLSGVVLEDASVSLSIDRRKKIAERGAVLFTHNGLSGPAPINLSRLLCRDFKKDEVDIILDCVPNTDKDILLSNIKQTVATNGARSIKRLLCEYVPRSVAFLILERLNIDPEKKLAVLRKKETFAIADGLKSLSWKINGIGDEQIGIITDGGVSLKDIDPRTMRSRVINNLFFAGEVIDCIGPCGGFNLQIAWSTGHLAGISAAQQVLAVKTK